MEPIIKLKDLSIGYEEKAVLSGITFDICRSSFTAILGANGAGKSTLLKTLLGLIPPVSGEIHFETSPDHSTVFGYVPQTIHIDPLYPLTGFDVALMGVFGRVKPGRFVSHNDKNFVHGCLKATGADTFAKQRFNLLSGGQKQRVLIARALATKPDILVLDEPTAGVDSTATASILEFISQVHKERHLTVLLVTHDILLARKHADHVVWIHDGRLMAGLAADLFNRQEVKKILEMELS